MNSGDLISKLLQMQGQDNSDLDTLFSELAKRRVAAETEAASAKQQYENVDNAPLPSTSPLADLVTRAMGSVAGTFQGSRKPVDEANALIDKERQALLVKRTQDLARLDSHYEKAAERARKLGDEDTAMQFQIKREQTNKTRGELLDLIKAQLGYEGDVYKANAAATWRATAAENKLQQMEIFTPKIEYSPSGFPYINQDKLPPGSVLGPSGKIGSARLIAQNYAVGKGVGANKDAYIANAQEANVIGMVRDAKANIATIRATILPSLATSWNDPKRLTNLVAANAGADPVLSSYPAIRTAAIQFIQTIAGLGKGLRINQAEIQAALRFDIPTVTDPQDVAEGKLKLLETMINHVERAASGQPTYSNEASEVAEFIRKSKQISAKGQKGMDKVSKDAALDNEFK